MCPKSITYKCQGPFHISLRKAIALINSCYVEQVGYCETTGQLEWIYLSIMHDDERDVGDPTHRELINTVTDMLDRYRINKN